MSDNGPLRAEIDRLRDGFHELANEIGRRSTSTSLKRVSKIRLLQKCADDIRAVLADARLIHGSDPECTRGFNDVCACEKCEPGALLGLLLRVDEALSNGAAPVKDSLDPLEAIRFDVQATIERLRRP